MSEPPSVQLQLAICSDLALMRSMLDDYLLELTQGVQGQSEYPHFDAYWTEPGRLPYFINLQGKSVGLAFVRTPASTGHARTELAEFYVAPDHRDQGIALAALRKLFGQHPGAWTLNTNAGDESPQSFWQHVLARAGAHAIRASAPTPRSSARVGLSFEV